MRRISGESVPLLVAEAERKIVCEVPSALMFEINPVAWYESAVTGGLERDVAKELLGAGLSMMITGLWTLRTLPVIGKTLGAMAVAAKLNLWNRRLLQEVAVTIPKSMEDPDVESQYVTTSIQKENQ